MSNNLRDLLRASVSMEGNVSDEAVIRSIEAIEISTPPEAPTVADMMEDKAAATALAEQVEVVADAAMTAGQRAVEGEIEEPATVATLESLNLAYTSIMASHRLKATGVSLESLGGARFALNELGAKARDMASRINASASVSLESMDTDHARAVAWMNKEGTSARQALSQSIAKLKSKQKSLDENGVTLNYFGILNFLSRDDTVVSDVLAEIKADFDLIKDLQAVDKQFVDFYRSALDAIKTIGANGVGNRANDLNRVLSKISDFDPLEVLKPLDGRTTLFNGHISLSATEEGSDVIELNYEAMYDGSKKSLGKNIISAFGTAGVVGLFGAAYGAIGGPVVSLALGGVLFTVGGVSSFVGALKGTPHKEQGKKTTRAISASELISSLELLVAAQDLRDQTGKLTDTVYREAVKVDQLFDAFVSLVSEQSSSDTLKITIAKVVSDITNAGSADSASDKLASYIRDHIDAVYAAHMSLAETIVAHTYWLARGGLMLAKNVIEQTK